MEFFRRCDFQAIDASKQVPAAVEEPLAFDVPRQGSADLPNGSNEPFIPWMQITDALLGHLGFMPGERVHFSVDYTKRHICIRQAFDWRRLNEQGPRKRPLVFTCHLLSETLPSR